MTDLTRRPDNSPAAVEERMYMADPSAEPFINSLIEQIKDRDVQMAVVDCLGYMFQNARGEMVTIDRFTPDRIRYGARSMAHVAVYGFPVLYFNPAALTAIEAEHTA